MATDLPPGYQPSADEEFMNPTQVEYFRQRLESTWRPCGGNLRQSLHQMPMI